MKLITNLFFAYFIALNFVSGKSINQTYNNEPLPFVGRSDKIKQLPELFYEPLTLSASAAQDVNIFVPNIIVFNLGGNDFALGIPDKATYVSKFIKIIDTTRVLFPDANIIISQISLSSTDTVLFSEEYAAIEDFTSTIYNHYCRKGDSKVYRRKYEESGINVWGQDLHPSVMSYEYISQSLKCFVLNNVGIGRVSYQNNISDPASVVLYPNPVNFELTLNGSDTTSEWSIVSLQGQEIMKGSGIRIWVGGLPVGMYCLLSDGKANWFLKQ